MPAACKVTCVHSAAWPSINWSGPHTCSYFTAITTGGRWPWKRLTEYWRPHSWGPFWSGNFCAPKSGKKTLADWSIMRMRMVWFDRTQSSVCEVKKKIHQSGQSGWLTTAVLLCWCRDSGQPDVFFTLSYHSDDGPISVRIQLNDLLFNLCGSKRTFPSLFSLLAYYSSSSCKLTTPYRKQRPELLKQMCRRALIRTYRAKDINSLPGLSKIKDYVHAYPYCI